MSLAHIKLRRDRGEEDTAKLNSIARGVSLDRAVITSRVGVSDAPSR